MAEGADTKKIIYRVDNDAVFCYNKFTMTENVIQGKFIVFEGTDGSGKSTQMKLLGKYLQERGETCRFTREPTGSTIGALVHACMTGEVDTDEHTIAALFAADRLDHINHPKNGMKAALGSGDHVLCDRYYFSSFAYNGGFVPLDWVIQLNTPAMQALKPDLVIFLDVDVEESMSRVATRAERERYETVEKQKRIRENYFQVFDRFKEENVVVIKSEADKLQTQAKVRAAVDKLFGWSK